MPAHEERFSRCFRAIEKELDRRGLDYTIHGLPGVDDIIHFEEYWLTNLPERTKLFPAVGDADRGEGWDEMIVGAVKPHAVINDTTAYYVVRWGDSWTEERLDVLGRKVDNRLQTGI